MQVVVVEEQTLVEQDVKLVIHSVVQTIVDVVKHCVLVDEEHFVLVDVT